MREMKESKELIEYQRKLPAITKSVSTGRCEAVSVKRGNTYKRILLSLAFLWRFAALFVAFAAIFTAVSALSTGLDAEVKDCDVTTTDAMQSTEEIETYEPSVTAGVTEEPPIIINEARIDEAVDVLFGEYDKSPPAFKLVSGVSVAVIHAHPSERVSETMTALEAGDVLAMLLSSAGVGAVHIDQVHDSEGKLGAYDKMLGSIDKAGEKYEGLLIIIDLHGSEADSPVSFSVGVDTSVGWQENLRVAYAVAAELEYERPVIRLLPGDLGQHSGIITVSVAIGHPEASEEEARKILADLSVAVISLFRENTRKA